MKSRVTQDSLTAIYDLRYAPTSYDFGIFLVLADCINQLRGQGSFSVNVLCNDYQSRGQGVEKLSRQERIWKARNIFQSLSSLVPNIDEFKIITGPPPPLIGNLFPFNWTYSYRKSYLESYVARNAVELYYEGANPNVFRSTEMAREYVAEKYKTRYVTLSLNNSIHNEYGTDLDAWYRFYQYIESFGFDVFVIPDQEDLLFFRKFKSYPWKVFESASINLDLRFSFYEHAATNFCNFSRLTSLLFYSKAPVIQFDQLINGERDEPFWAENFGFKPGEQYPWASAEQIMTWELSGFDRLCQYFDAFLASQS
ncbi:MAG: hypothetical protein COB04_05350 [Gammaproteobacteria bacterium]|nr:MAG: hypothetical protein COB04_05350 [Gammaproteobacteria bacterium]